MRLRTDDGGRKDVFCNGNTFFGVPFSCVACSAEAEAWERSLMRLCWLFRLRTATTTGWAASSSPPPPGGANHGRVTEQGVETRGWIVSPSTTGLDVPPRRSPFRQVNLIVNNVSVLGGHVDRGTLLVAVRARKPGLRAQPTFGIIAIISHSERASMFACFEARRNSGKLSDDQLQHI